MKVPVYGSGYVGLAHRAVLAEVGNDAVCVNADAVRVEYLRLGLAFLCRIQSRVLVERFCGK